MARKLPVRVGWTVDCRLKEFRRVNPSATQVRIVKFSEVERKGSLSPRDYVRPGIEYVPFDSARGERIMARIGYDKMLKLCRSLV